MSQKNPKPVKSGEEKKEVFAFSITPSTITKLNNILGYGSRSAQVEQIFLDYIKKNENGDKNPPSMTVPRTAQVKEAKNV